MTTMQDKSLIHPSPNKKKPSSRFGSVIFGSLLLSAFVLGYNYSSRHFVNKTQLQKEERMRSSFVIANKYDASKIAFKKSWEYWYDSTYVQPTSIAKENCWHTQEVPYTLKDSLGNEIDTFKIVPYDMNRNMLIDRYYDKDTNLLLTVRVLDVDNDNSYDCVDSIVDGNRDEDGMLVNDFIKRVWSKDNSKFNVGRIRYVLSPHSKMILQNQEPSLTYENSFYYTKDTWFSSSTLKKTCDD